MQGRTWSLDSRTPFSAEHLAKGRKKRLPEGLGENKPAWPAPAQVWKSLPELSFSTQPRKSALQGLPTGHTQPRAPQDPGAPTTGLSQPLLPERGPRGEVSQSRSSLGGRWEPGPRARACAGGASSDTACWALTPILDLCPGPDSSPAWERWAWCSGLGASLGPH